MSREIKCRVYSKRLKVYIDYYTIGFSKSGELQYISDKHGAGPVFAGDYIVEQYTSRKDKNGKEIYEGDVIKYLGEYFTVMRRLAIILFLFYSRLMCLACSTEYSAKKTA